MEKTRASSFWSGLGKIATILGVIWIGIQIYNYFSKSDYKIVANCEFSELLFPDSFILDLDKFEKTLESDSITNLFQIKGDLLNQYQTTKSIQSKLMSQFPKDLQKNLETLRSLWRFSIKNEGTRELSDIDLQLPFDGLFRVQKLGEKSLFSTFKNNIRVGSIRPGNEVVVIVWSSVDADVYYLDKSQISHPNGVNNIDYPEKVTGVLAWCTRHISSFVIFISFIPLIFLMFSVLSDEIKRKKSKSRNEVNATKQQN
jgi:hypothetical protein